MPQPSEPAGSPPAEGGDPAEPTETPAETPGRRPNRLRKPPRPGGHERAQTIVPTNPSSERTSSPPSEAAAQHGDEAVPSEPVDAGIIEYPHTPGGGSGESSGAPARSSPSGSRGGGPGGAATLPSSRAGLIRFSSALAAVAMSCGLPTLASPVAGVCAAAWGNPGERPSAPSGASPSGRTATKGGPPPGGGNGGSGGGGRSVAPPPAPAPGGAFGGSGGGGSSGVPSGFLTLAGLLLLAAPRAMRRLRLSCRPSLTAFFVLIPERPG